MTGLKRIALAATALALVQGAAQAQDTAPDMLREALAGALPEMTDLPDIRSDSRRRVPDAMDADMELGGKAGPALAGAPVDPAPLPAAPPLLRASSTDGKGVVSGDVVMTGGGPGPSSTPYDFSLDSKDK